MATIIEYKDIPLQDLTIGKAQVRMRETGKEIDELARSIDRQGLLEPIIVAPVGEGKYEIVLGQRRFLAHQFLKRPTIRAGILEEQIDETTAKVLSVTENLIRRQLTRRDLIDVCTYLYKKYGSVKEVAEETGLPPREVSQYVKFERLIPELKDLVETGNVDLKVALRAQDAVALSGSYNPDEAIKLAREMSGMSGAQQRKVRNEIIQDPSSAIDDVIESAKTGGRITQIVVTLGGDAHASLKRFATDEGTNMDDAAASLIEEGLLGKGYLESE